MSKERTGLEIAIIGMAGRFPGSQNINELWENLKDGKECIATFTDEELEEAGISPDIYNHPDYVKAKGFLDKSEHFDSELFNYTDSEAAIMDPQIRILHECAYEALENAGYNPFEYKGLIGFYGGALPNHYWEQKASFLADLMDEQFDALHLIDKDFTNSRVSYKLDLRGPSITIATACSTSLSSVHMACRSLLIGECSMALAGASTLLMPGKSGYLYREGTIFSKDGKVRAFSSDSNGTVGGEGVGVVVLKPLGKALEDGDTIYAVIKGSAINCDGAAKAGYTAPNVEGPAQAVKMAMKFGRVEPETITYVETHGTGTRFGDQIEFEALRKAFGSPKRNFCAIGSHKPNLGYLGPASGIASLIKVVLSLYHKQIPPTINYSNPNQGIDIDNSPFYINNSLIEWKSDEQPRRAGVNNIAVGGTNAHVVLEEAPQQEVYPSTRDWKVLTLSAKSKDALDVATGKLAQCLKENKNIVIDDAAYTLQVGRKAYNHRRTVVCSGVDDAVESLLTLNAKSTKTAFADEPSKKVFFVFPDSLPFYEECTRELYEKEIGYRKEAQKCCEILNKINGSNVLEFFTEGRKLESFENTEELTFIVQYSMAKLLLDWGIKPDGMFGYGIGEYSAAAISEVFTVEEALRLLITRSRILDKCSKGNQLKVSLPASKLEMFLNENVSILAYLDQETIVIGGSSEAIIGLQIELEKHSVCCSMEDREIRAYTGLSESLTGEFSSSFSGIKAQIPCVPLISSLSGTWSKNEDLSTSDYWIHQMTDTKNIDKAIALLLENKSACIIEMGMGDRLANLINRHPVKNNDHAVLPCIRNQREKYPDSRFIADRLARLWCMGLCVDWGKMYKDEKRRRISLHSYPFQRKDFSLNGKITYSLKKGRANI